MPTRLWKWSLTCVISFLWVHTDEQWSPVAIRAVAAVSALQRARSVGETAYALEAVLACLSGTPAATQTCDRLETRC